jgi:protochlorophyllide reductase
MYTTLLVLAASVCAGYRREPWAFKPVAAPRTPTTYGRRTVEAPVATASSTRDAISLKEKHHDHDAAGQKAYIKRELPKVAGSLKIGLRKVVVVTGASSGLGLSTAKSLCDQGYFVVAAVRDTKKMKNAALENGISKNDFVSLQLELASLQSVKDFVDNLKLYLAGRPLDSLICNAAIYNPRDPEPSWTDDGYEMALGVNHLGHFLMVQLLLPELKKAKDGRCIIVGSVTGNKNTVAGSVVKPVADLGDLEGLRAGGGRSSTMAASKFEAYNGAKAYKDAKALNMITALEMHRRYHDDTGITFSSMYPGCIADTALFRKKRKWWGVFFPNFMKFIGAYVSEPEAGDRLAQVIADPKCSKSGIYWSWNGNAKKMGQGSAGGAGGEIFENQYSGMVRNEKLGRLAFEYSMEAVKDYL